MGEASSIALCRQEEIKLVFTDDLSARETANMLGLESHGTIAIVLRSYRKRLITKEETKKTLENLYTNSTLFFTSLL